MWKLLPRLFLLLTAIAPASALALPSEKLNWVEIRTNHFLFYSSAAEDRTSDVAVALEQYRSLLDEFIPGRPDEQRELTPVFLFGSTRSYEPYNLRTPSGEPSAASGFCAQSPYGYTIAIDATPGRLYRALIYHEYVHYLLFERFPGLPIWLHEGLAEYFSTLSVEDGSARVGFAPQGHVDWLLTNEAPQAYLLLDATAESVNVSEVERAGPFYAGSWLLVHYLLHDAGGKPLTVERLLGLRTVDAPYNRSLLEALGVSRGELAERLVAYGTKKSFAFDTTPLEAAAAIADGDSRPVNRAELLTRLGELLSFVHADHDAAAEHFRATLALDPTQASAAIGLSYAGELSGNPSAAAEWFGKASGLAPSDPTVYLKRADSLIISFQDSHPGETPLGEQLDPHLGLARQSAEKAIELNAGLGRAHAAKGLTYVYDPGDVAPGVAALEKAHELEPGSPEITAHLAVLLARSGDFERADTLLTEVRNTALEADLVRRARRAVSLAKHSYVGKLGQEGRFNEAIMLLGDMIEETTDPAYRQTLEDEVRRLRDYDRYRQAVALANGGQLENARKILQELQSKSLDDSLGKHVSDLLAQLDEMLER